MQIAKWGNSLAVRLPAALVQEMGLSAGDEVQLVPQPHKPAKAKVLAVAAAPTRAERIEALKQFQDSLPDDYRFKRDDAYDE